MFIRILFTFFKLSIIFILTYILIRALRFYFAVKGAYKQSGYDKQSYTDRRGDTAGKTVKCANCASYVASELAVEAKEKGETLFFCSEDCKNGYVSNR